MGRPKALLPMSSAGETFLDRVTRTLLDGGVDGLYVVVGADADAIRANAPETPGVRIVDNPDYEQGQLTSLQVVLRADRSVASVSGALVTLIDVPLVTADTVRMLLAAHRELAASIVRPVSNGRHGHPVIFHRRLFGELLRADPTRGAKAVVRAHEDETHDVLVNDEGRVHRHRHARGVRAVDRGRGEGEGLTVPGRGSSAP